MAFSKKEIKIIKEDVKESKLPLINLAGKEISNEVLK